MYVYFDFIKDIQNKLNYMNRPKTCYARQARFDSFRIKTFDSFGIKSLGQANKSAGWMPWH